MRVKVTELDQLPRDRGVRVTIGDRRIAMFRIEDDVYAIGDKCSHAEASLAEGELWDTSVECPRHGSEFDLKSGEPHALPATEPVPVYPVTIDDGIVYLELEDE
ncbi:MAG TPA: non-heme iron oxygenase ferredoxin subunit [Acidimicrobiia bacterium]